jgi:hypothetical protein
VACFHIDESCYTGPNLLKAQQRFQGVTAVTISHDEAPPLIRAHFAMLQAPELTCYAPARRLGF